APAGDAVRGGGVLEEPLAAWVSGIRGDREAEADGSGFAARRVRGRDRDIDADQLARAIDERASRVTGVDRGIRLQHGDLDRLVGGRVALALLLTRQIEEPGRLLAA